MNLIITSWGATVTAPTEKGVAPTEPEPWDTQKGTGHKMTPKSSIDALSLGS